MLRTASPYEKRRKKLKERTPVNPWTALSLLWRSTSRATGPKPRFTREFGYCYSI